MEEEEDRIIISGALDALNTTVLSLQCNANFALYTQEQLNDFTEEMKTLFFEDMQPYKRFVFGDKFLVPKVEYTGLEVDTGPKFNKAHVHISLVMKHKVQKYSLEKLRIRLQDTLNKVYTRSNGWYVHIKLVSFKDANYNNKNARAAQNERVENDPEYAEELERLSDPRTLFVYKDKKGKTKKKLAWNMEDLMAKLKLEEEGEG